MNWSLGFGFERLGLVVLRFPRISTFLLLLSLIASVFSLTGLGFDGNIINVLDKNSRDYSVYVESNKKFYDFSADVSVVLKSDSLVTAKTLENMRNLHLDLTLEEGIESVFSIFSLADAALYNDQSDFAFPSEFKDDEQAQNSIQNLIRIEPATRSIVSPEKNTMIILVRLSEDAYESEVTLSAGLTNLEQKLSALLPPDVQFGMTGIPPMRAAIIDAIIQDQTLLTALGLVLGCGVSWLIFGTARAAVISTIPALISVIWVLAAFAVSGTKLNIFTTALPSLALIITLADTIVLYYRWQALNNSDGGAPLENLKRAIKRVGPASSLTSITTALAFASFSWASSESLDEFSKFGVIAVIAAFISVIIGLPVIGYWATRLSSGSQAGRGPRLTNWGGQIAQITTVAPKKMLFLATVFVLILAWVHTQLKPSFSLQDYLPYGSQVRETEQFTAQTFGGSSSYNILVPVLPDKPYFAPENRDRLIAVHDAVAKKMGVERTQSLASAWKRFSQSQIDELVATLPDAPKNLRGRFISDDLDMYQVNAIADASKGTFHVVKQVADLREQLDKLLYGNEVSITGYTVLVAFQFPKLLSELQTGLLISIMLAMVVLAIATRSVMLAVASFIPNIFPILFTEALIWVSGFRLDISNVIALTIAFGIAIDNAVHVINAYENARHVKGTLQDRVRFAVSGIAPALVASTCIVCIAALITQFSSMPSVGELGLLLIATLIVALISNIVILPSAMIVALTWGNRENSQNAEH